MQTDIYTRGTKYVPVGFQVGVERPRRLGPRDFCRIGSALHCGEQFSRSSRPDTFPQGEPLRQLPVKGIIEFRQPGCTQLASIPSGVAAGVSVHTAILGG